MDKSGTGTFSMHVVCKEHKATRLVKLSHEIGLLTNVVACNTCSLLDAETIFETLGGESK